MYLCMRMCVCHAIKVPIIVEIKKKKKLVGGEHVTYTLKLDFQFFISFL